MKYLNTYKLFESQSMISLVQDLKETLFELQDLGIKTIVNTSHSFDIVYQKYVEGESIFKYKDIIKVTISTFSLEAIDEIKDSITRMNSIMSSYKVDYYVGWSPFIKMKADFDEISSDYNIGYVPSIKIINIIYYKIRR